MIRRLIGSFILATVLLVGLPSRASAKTVTLSLTGTIMDATTNAFVFNGRNYVQGSLILSGLTPFDLEEGDIVNATISLDSPYTVPMSGEQLFAFSLLTGGGDNGQPTSNSATLTFGNSMGPTGLPTDIRFGACSNCLSTITSGGGNPFSFDSLSVNMIINQLTPSPFRIGGASINYQLADALGAVPEPATWAMLILGFGAVGLQLRRRRAQPARLAFATA